MSSKTNSAHHVSNRSGSRLVLGVGGFLLTAMFAWSPAAHAMSADPNICQTFAEKDIAALRSGTAPARIVSGEMARDVQLDSVGAQRLHFMSRVMSAPYAANKPMPAHCVLRGYVNPNIQFEMRLPVASAWNGKFLFVSCDGFCGRVDRHAVMAGVARNYATITTDGGHVGAEGFDSIWAIGNTQAKIDFAYRGTHRATLAAKTIITEFYGRGPRYSYITGCSKGGQAGVMEAQRYPNDFNGVIARGPTVDYTGVNILSCAQRARAVYARDGSIVIDASRLELVKAAVLQACDGTDGVRDGIIADPRRCGFDPGTLECKGATVTSTCLSKAEVTALRKIYSPVRDRRGNDIYPAMSFGSESGWGRWILPRDRDHLVYSYRAASGYLTNFAFEQPVDKAFNWYDFDWDRDRDLLAPISAMVDVHSPDFSAFRDAGGKMIVVHGWSDEAIPAEASIRWYEGVARFMGGRDALASFARLFLLPGVQHCGSDGPGPSTYDALQALEAWVEKGVAPNSLMTSQEATDGRIARMRPVYRFPMQTKYAGKGDPDAPSSFVAIDRQD